MGGRRHARTGFNPAGSGSSPMFLDFRRGGGEVV